MSSGLKVALIATVILALSIVGVLAKDRLEDDAVQARETGAGRDTDKPDDEAKPTGKPLELGTVAKVSSNYRVAVTELSRYDVPTGQLIAVTIDATYTGKQDGEPWADLMVEFSGTGSQTFGESDCPFDLDDMDPAEQPTLKTGDETTYALCIAIPKTDLEGGRVAVEEAFSSTSNRIAWSTKDAVTKALPSPPPELRSGKAGQPRRQPATSNERPEECEKYEDDVEEYKDGIDDFDEWMERYKNHPDSDDDKVEDFEDWKDAMDKNVERYERFC